MPRCRGRCFLRAADAVGRVCYSYFLPAGAACCRRAWLAFSWCWLGVMGLFVQCGSAGRMALTGSRAGTVGVSPPRCMRRADAARVPDIGHRTRMPIGVQPKIKNLAGRTYLDVHCRLTAAVGTHSNCCAAPRTLLGTAVRPCPAVPWTLCCWHWLEAVSYARKQCRAGGFPVLSSGAGQWPTSASYNTICVQLERRGWKVRGELLCASRDGRER